MSAYFVAAWNMIKQNYLTLILILVLHPGRDKAQACWDDKGTKTTGDATVIRISSGESNNDCTTACANEPFCLGVTYESFGKVCYMFNSVQEKTIGICFTCRFLASTCKGETIFANPRLPSAEVGCYFTSHGTYKTAEETETENAIFSDSDECREYCDITVGCVAVTYSFVYRKCYLFDALTVKTSSLCAACVLLERVCIGESSSPLTLSSVSSASLLTEEIDPSFSSMIATETNIIESTVKSSYYSDFVTSATSNSIFIPQSSNYITTETPTTWIFETESSLLTGASSFNHVMSFFSSELSSEQIHPSSSETYNPYTTIHSSGYETLTTTTSYFTDIVSSTQESHKVTSSNSSHVASLTTDLSSTTISEELTSSPKHPVMTSDMTSVLTTALGENCFCTNCSTVSQHNRTLEKQLLYIRNVLYLNKTNLSLSRRKKYSAPDERQSSKIIGSIGGIVLALLVVIVAVPDISKACSHVVSVFRR